MVSGPKIDPFMCEVMLEVSSTEVGSTDLCCFVGESRSSIVLLVLSRKDIL